MTENRGYPRPQLERAEWTSLNGVWAFTIDRDGLWEEPGQVRFDRRIRVPFSPETPMSGIEDQSLYRACWYRRELVPPPLAEGQRLLLHFGAVDYEATVFVDGFIAARHVGGYTPFTVDLTSFARAGRPLDLVVHAEDDPADLAKPRGKQDWLEEAHSIWYPRTTGIWQTVWLEVVPAVRFGCITWSSSLTRWEVGFETWLEGPRLEGLQVELVLRCRDALIARDRYDIDSHECHRRIALSDPGIDDSRNSLLWSPQHPNLMDARLRLLSREGNLLDEVRSYTALRAVEVDDDRVVLNGRPYNLRMVLDQGYWPRSGLTAPDDDALKRDVQLAKAMGFNGVRKHQKIEDPRYLYWADHLGLAVWEEMPSAYRFNQAAVARVTREWSEAVRRDISHPCIFAWVPINESWGVPNLPQSPMERSYVQALYHLTHTLDPSRPVVGNDGWEAVATDIIGIHDYDADPARIAHRYHADRMLPHLLRKERPGGRILVVGDHEHHSDRPVMLTEFGGIAVTSSGIWGYSQVRTAAELGRRYAELLEVVSSLGMFSGFCYTQFADTYQEANGLLRADRTPKFPLEAMAAATCGNSVRGTVTDDGGRG